MSQERSDIELLAGDLPAAEAVLREACAALEELGEQGFLGTRAACLGLCLALQNRAGEAEPFLELAERSMTEDEADVVSITHAARAVALLSHGALSEAEDHARQALAAIADWDHPNFKGDTLVRLADILQAAGRADEAVAAYSEALTLYEQKENLVALVESPVPSRCCRRRRRHERVPRIGFGSTTVTGLCRTTQR